MRLKSYCRPDMVASWPNVQVVPFASFTLTHTHTRLHKDAYPDLGSASAKRAVLYSFLHKPLIRLSALSVHATTNTCLGIIPSCIGC